MFALFSLAGAMLVAPHEERAFVSWMRSTNQVYAGDEYHLRLGCYLAASRFVQSHNAKGTFKVSLNKFAALTPTEYRAMLGFRPGPRRGKTSKTAVNYPESIDWREKGAVTEIKDQGQCGSCWAFSTIMGCEGANQVKTGTLLSFSESNLVDCVDTCLGCMGGFMAYAIEYVLDEQDGYFNLESDYPYQPVKRDCAYDKSKRAGRIRNYVEVEMNDEDDLATKVSSMGPVCVAIDASQMSFQLYTSGIYDEPHCSPANLDHGVGCVGYGVEDGVKYWIVKNSWGTVWGEQGYIRMIWKNNQCGIATSGCVPYA